jgi:hypothetical protein
MTTRDELIAAIRRTLGPAFSPPPLSAGATGRSGRSKDGHLYEQFLFSLVIRAAERENANITYWDALGNQVATASVFREGPGQICSTRRPYTHALILLPDLPPLEVHVGVKVSGASDVVHECDFLVLPQVEAETCRRQQVLPRSSRIVFAIECKLYGPDVPLREGRGFLGLTMDFPGKDLFFVTNVSSPSVVKLLEKKDRLWEHMVTPTPFAQTEPLEVELLISAFQKTFRRAAVEAT